MYCILSEKKSVSQFLTHLTCNSQTRNEEERTVLVKDLMFDRIDKFRRGFLTSGGWRDVVEDYGYLKDNVLLSKYNPKKIINFLQNLNFTYPNVNDDYSPSKDFVIQFKRI